MAVIRLLSRILFSLFLLLHFFQVARAEKRGKGESGAKLLFNFYHQEGDGHQVYQSSNNTKGKEDVTAFEPMLFIDHQITEKTNINGQFVIDIWSAASDTSLDGSTGASGEGIGGQSRISGRLGAVTETSIGSWSYGLGYSSEHDYSSLNAGLSWEKSFAEDNFTLALGTQVFLDSVQLFNLATEQLKADEDRDIYAFNVSMSQLITSKDIAQWGYDYINMDGALESTASFILLNGVRSAEVLPEKRKRHAVWGRWVHSLSETMSLNLKVRHYTDDWDVDAQTYRSAWLISLFEDDAFVELAYRFHHQNRSKYFRHRFDSTQEFMTSDSDLDQFDAHQWGIFLSVNLSDWSPWGLIDFENLVFTSSWQYYQRSNDLYYTYLQTGLALEF